MTIGRLTQQLLCTTNLGANEIAKAPDGGGSAPRMKSQRSRQYMQLEPRVMFDGAVVGEFDLGFAQLIADSILGNHADELAIVKSALTDNADILIYRCDFASGAAGQRAIEQLGPGTVAACGATVDAVSQTIKAYT
jgi:Domain of unknown function (DUF4347)